MQPEPRETMEQTSKEVRRLAWIMDARQRGEAIERESEVQKNQLDHAKKLATAARKANI